MVDKDTNDEAIAALAKRLFELQYEWSNSAYISGNISPFDSEVGFFGPNSYYSSGDYFDVGIWKQNDLNDASFFNRCSDTPSSWPTSNEASCPKGRHSSESWQDSDISRSCDNFDDPFPMTQHDVNDWLKALQPPKPTRPGYTCRICGKGDHYVQNCPLAPPRDQLSTPYQGHNQCYGMFSCEKCGKEWGSHNSSAQMGQICRRCQHFVYPSKQYPLDKIPPSQLKKRRPHGKGRK